MKIVFVLGVPRSGTTLIANTLANSENACYLPRSLRILERFGLGGCFRLARVMASFSQRFPSLRLGWHRHNGGHRFWSKFEAIENRDDRSMFLNAAVYPDASTGRVFVNKRIANVNLLDVLAATFPGAILVHVKRNPLDTIQSLLNRRERLMGSIDKRWGVYPASMPEQNPDPLVDCALQYRTIYETIEETKKLFAEYISIEYEDFCADPEFVIQDVADRMGLQTLAGQTQSISLRKPDHMPGLAATVSSVLAESWQIRLKDQSPKTKA